MINKYFKTTINILGFLILLLIVFLYNINKIYADDFLISILACGSIWVILHEMEIVNEKNESRS